MTESYFELIIIRRRPNGSIYNDERIRFRSLVEAEYEVAGQAATIRGPEEEDYKIYCLCNSPNSNRNKREVC